MGVLYDIYCVPPKPFSVDWSALFGKLIVSGLVRPPLWAGHPVRTIETFSLLRSPDLAPLEAMVGGEPDSPRAFENFHPMASHLGLYRFRGGHHLEIEERWSGEVFELLWLHGKNAPLLEDFAGSRLHVAVNELWPGCLVLADERL
jgi:hypothetical protein